MSKSAVLWFALWCAACSSRDAAAPSEPPAPPTGLDAVFAEMRAGDAYEGIDAVLVERAGHVVVEEYFGDWSADRLHDSRSSFKSVTSLLLGIAVDRGALSLDDRVVHWLPPELTADLPPDSPKRAITVRHLVSMTAGFDCEEFFERGPMCEPEMWRSEDWVAFAWNRPMSQPPGRHWSYNSEQPVLLGAVIARATGRSVQDFAREALFEPLGITRYRWTTDPRGNAMTAGSFYIRPRDMLALGRLVLQRGAHDGQRIVSSRWLDESTRGLVELEDGFNFARIGGRRPDGTSRNQWPGQKPTRYGYYWYREVIRYGADATEAEVLFASGNGGQYIMVIPELDMVVVFTGSNYDNWRGKRPFDLLIHHLLPALA